MTVALALALLAGGCDDGGSGTDAGRPRDAGAGRDASGSDAGPASDGGASDASSPTPDGGVPTPGLSYVATGEYQVFYMVDGRIYAMGTQSPVLGVGPSAPIAMPPVSIAVPEDLRFRAVSSGLHQSLAVDVNGHVWTWGDVQEGRRGDGSTEGADASTPFMITEDADGAPFDHVVNVYGTTRFNAALKDDGTVWVWGNCQNGIPGDGTDGGVVTRPTQVPFPAGVEIVEVAAALTMLARDRDNVVWQWGAGETYADRGTGSMEFRFPQPITALPSDIVQISNGCGHYALTSTGSLWGWGQRGAYLGTGELVPVPLPIELDDTLDLPAPVREVRSSSLATHVILTDGTLWGWGDAATGAVGDGQILDYSMTDPPYAWSFEAYQLMVHDPVRIAPSVSNFAHIFTNAAYCFYAYAQTEDGHLYSWGRNKTPVLGNGVYAHAANGNPGTASQMAAAYPNSWDVPLATEVHPMTQGPVPTNSPYCIANPTAPSC
ncbi:MAG: RCC1 domain-containing protein [Sandaracinaceae bacterium]